MKPLVFALAAAAAALSSQPSSAMPLARIAPAAEAQQVRLVCDAWGRCWRTGRAWRPDITVQNGYGWQDGYARWSGVNGNYWAYKRHAPQTGGCTDNCNR